MITFFPHLTIFHQLSEPQFFNSASVSNIRYQSYVGKEQMRDSSCVLFIKNGQQHIGCILMIIRDENEQVLFFIQPVIIEKTHILRMCENLYMS